MGAFSEEEQMVQRTARDFADRVLRSGVARRDRTGDFPIDELQQIAKLGLLGVNVPEAFGGAEAGAVAYALAILELAQVCPSTAVTVAVTNMVAEVICQFGSNQQKERCVPDLVSGGATCGAFALSEPHCGSDAAALNTTAKRTADGWMLNGSKQWITSGDRAGVFVVWARTGQQPGPKGISAFLVEGTPDGMNVGKHEDKMGIRGSSTTSLILRTVLSQRMRCLEKRVRAFASL